MTGPSFDHEPAEESARSALLRMIRGFRLSQMIAVAAKLRIADHLANGPKPVEELALALGCHRDSLYRVLRLLAGCGIFAEEDGCVFRLTPYADLLRSDVVGSLRVNAEVVGEEWMWLAWGSLMHTVTTGETAFDNVFGKNTWDWFAENPAAGRLFDECMDESTQGEIASILKSYDFTAARTIVDIAGGRGVLLAEILKRNASARGILFNLPSVIQAAKQCLDKETAGRIEFVSGSFFEEVPPGGDLYILKNILHDWNDEAAQNILATCRRAMRENTRLLIIEHLIGAVNRLSPGKVADVQMMVRNGGRNRTENEFESLLTKGGLNVCRIIQPGTGPAILEISTQC